MIESITVYHPDTGSDYFDQIQSELRDLGLEEGKHYKSSEDLPDDIPNKVNPEKGFMVVENDTIGEIYHSLEDAKNWAETANLESVEKQLSGQA